MSTDPIAKQTPKTAPSLADGYRRIRRATVSLCETLETEDFVVQSMEDASPTKWHLAHTTWFFETFVLREHDPGYTPRHAQYHYLFNSYYNALGKQYARPSRGLITRPTVAEVLEYREYVDAAVTRFLSTIDEPLFNTITPIITIGLNHEQQHQELLVTDIKHALSFNPLYPVFRSNNVETLAKATPLSWVEFAEGIYDIGHSGDGFSYDNEGPRHRVFLEPFALADRLVTNEEYMAFMADGGYGKSELWLSEGWTTVQESGWKAPLYWDDTDGTWQQFTLAGRRPVAPAEPVTHISYFEADAYARWAGARLATEFEWEVASAAATNAGNFVERALFHPAPAPSGNDGALRQIFGDAWEWTCSHYSAYPGYRPDAGALGEYNGKFMSNQFVLRGGSCVTPEEHIRRTYRNFFHSYARWQFSGIRLAQEV